MPPSPPTTLVLYDEDCGFCIWMVSVFLRMDRRHRLGVASIQDHRTSLLRHVPAAEVLGSWHAVAPGGETTSGGDALVTVFRLIPVLRPVGVVLDGLPRLRRRLYLSVAARRATFAAFVPERSKAAARGLVASRRAPEVA